MARRLGIGKINASAGNISPGQARAGAIDTMAAGAEFVDKLAKNPRNYSTYLRALREVPSVEIIRIGTRTPVVMPQRITPRLVRMRGESP